MGWVFIFLLGRLGEESRCLSISRECGGEDVEGELLWLMYIWCIMRQVIFFALGSFEMSASIHSKQMLSWVVGRHTVVELGDSFHNLWVWGGCCEEEIGIRLPAREV